MLSPLSIASYVSAVGYAQRSAAFCRIRLKTEKFMDVDLRKLMIEEVALLEKKELNLQIAKLESSLVNLKDGGILGLVIVSRRESKKMLC